MVRAYTREMTVKNTAEYQPKADPSMLRGERFDGWGYSDTNFTLENGVISLGGNRYEISGKRMPALLSWASGILGVDLKLQDDYTPKGLTPIPAARDLPELIEALTGAGISHTQDDLARRRHGHGHALEEVYAIKLGRLHRAPDMVTSCHVVDVDGHLHVLELRVLRELGRDLELLRGLARVAAGDAADTAGANTGREIGSGNVGEGHAEIGARLPGAVVEVALVALRVGRVATRLRGLRVHRVARVAQRVVAERVVLSAAA